MKINKYKVRVDFDVAVVSGGMNAEKLMSELNVLFHEMVKAWVKDNQALATPTRTTVEGINDAD